MHHMSIKNSTGYTLKSLNCSQIKKNDVQLTLYNVRIRHLVLSLLDMIPSVSLGEGYLYCWWLIWTIQNDAKKLEND